MNLEISKVSDITVVGLSCERLDAGNVVQFKQRIQDLIQNGDKLILDLSAVNFVDSTGLGAIISCLRNLSSKNGDLKLSGLTKQVRVLFELVRMHKVVEIFNSVDEARGAFTIERRAQQAMA